jgi:hypothetical protein
MILLEKHRLELETERLKYQVQGLRQLLTAAAYHVEGEGDVSLLADIRKGLSESER